MPFSPFRFADAAEIVGTDSQRVVDLVPWAEDVPPWSGPKQAPEERGRLYAEPGAMGSTILWFGRDRRHHAATIYPPERVGNVFRLNGRLWKIRRLEPVGPEAA